MSLGLLKAEIELRKRQSESREGGSGDGKKRKWFRRGDVEAKGREENEGRAEVVEGGDRQEGEAVLKDGGDGVEDSGSRKEESVTNVLLSVEEVIKRLRARGEPATLFGESQLDRYMRYKEIELRGEDVTKGQRNVFQMKMRAMKGDNDEELYLQREEDRKRPDATPADESSRQEEETPKTDEDYVRIQINKLTAKWKETLDQMPAEDKRTQKGRSAHATYEQSKEYLVPLLKKLRKRQLGHNVLDALKKIFQFVEQREYVKANDVYLKLAVGNAPWVMGATMVGIHARHAREKIGEGKIAHVMNDEPTRKFIQAVKRLITMAQSWNPTVPSKMISS